MTSNNTPSEYEIRKAALAAAVTLYSGTGSDSFNDVAGDAKLVTRMAGQFVTWLSEAVDEGEAQLQTAEDGLVAPALPLTLSTLPRGPQVVVQISEETYDPDLWERSGVCDVPFCNHSSGVHTSGNGCYAVLNAGGAICDCTAFVPQASE